jgi:putative ABC transport system ATP-binding protein
MSGASVEARGVSRRFERGSDEVWAVRDVTLSIAPGEVLALVGRSGSGKTTLLNILAGLDRPTSGEVSLDGERIDTMSEKNLTQLRRHKLGFVFQSFGLLPLLSAQENVELPLRIAGFGHGERVKRAKHALEVVGLTRRAHHRPYELSGGEQQRVAIARALTCEPSLILADEPTGELDSTTARAVFGLLRDLGHSEGITVITCTHDRMVMEMADRVEELADGRLVEGHSREVWQHVQAKQLSPFAAKANGNGRSLLDGGVAPSPAASPAQAAPAFERPPAPPPSPPVSAPETNPEPETERDDDPTRWARPQH